MPKYMKSTKLKTYTNKNLFFYELFVRQIHFFIDEKCNLATKSS